MDLLMELMRPQVGVSALVGLILAALAYLDRIDDLSCDEDADVPAGRARERR